jgi:hypothetical protein
MLGSEKIVYFYIGDAKCSVKLPPNFAVDENLVLKIQLWLKVFYKKFLIVVWLVWL